MVSPDVFEIGQWYQITCDDFCYIGQYQGLSWLPEKLLFTNFAADFHLPTQEITEVWHRIHKDYKLDEVLKERYRLPPPNNL